MMGFDYKSWYEKNAERLKKQRRQKYKKDKTYREAAKARARAWYDREKKPQRPADRTTVVSPDGKTYLSIGKLSEMIGKAVDTIRSYHRQGVIPVPDAFNVRGWRLYTDEQAKVIADAFALFDRGELSSLTEVKEEIQRNWKGGEDAKKEGGAARRSRNRIVNRS